MSFDYKEPEELKCPKCGHTVTWYESEPAPFHILRTQDGKTFCPHCVQKWIACNVEVMEKIK